MGSTLGYCPDLLIGLNEVAKANTPNLRVTPAGALQALNSPQNMPSLEIKEVDNKRGQERDIRVKYLQRLTEGDVDNTKNCDPATAQDYSEATVTLSCEKQVSVKITNAQLKNYCEASLDPTNAGNFRTIRELKDRLDNATNALRTAFNRCILTEMSTNFGSIPGHGGAVKNISVITSSDGSVVSKGLNDIYYDMVNSEAVGNPLIIGFGNFHRMNTALRYACCNDNGVDLNALPAELPYFYFKDLIAGDVFGNANYVAALAPGVMQLVTFNEHSPSGAVWGKIGDAEYYKYPDPVIPGLEYDMKFTFDTCDKIWQLDLSLEMGLFVMPCDSVKSNDRLYYDSCVASGAYLYNAQAV